MRPGRLRFCRTCKAVVRLHAFVTSEHDYCSKTCMCRGLGHKSNKECCVRCRGPLAKQIAPTPQEIVRSPRKTAKLMKRRKSQRPPALV